MKQSNELVFDDFPLSPHGIADAAKLYDAFQKCEELVGNLPRKLLGADPDIAIQQLLYDFYSYNSSESALFRKKSDASEALTMLWLSKVRTTARIFVSFNELPQFSGITIGEIEQIARLSVKLEAVYDLYEILLQKGIVLIYERSLPGMKLDGAVFNCGNQRPVIALSLRYSRLDIFWFTLIHELAHIALHSEILDEPILDDVDDLSDNLIERQADRAASQALISRHVWRANRCLFNPTEENVLNFAQKVNVHPAIIAGRIRRELNRHDILSNIVNEVNMREMIFGND